MVLIPLVRRGRYILHEAEEQGLLLPWACRMGCCTACAVRVLEGHLHQPQALGVSEGLRAQGFALMCVAYPRSDAVLETVEVRLVPCYLHSFCSALSFCRLHPEVVRFACAGILKITLL